jgi:hypothetical protein
MMLVGAALALIAWRCSKNMRGTVTALNSNARGDLDGHDDD